MPTTKASKPAAKRAGAVTAAVKRDLEAIRRRDPELAESALAASALALAREMDSKTLVRAKELRETLDRLRQLAPPEQKEDGVDELNDRRAKRRTARRRAAT